MVQGRLEGDAESYQLVFVWSSIAYNVRTRAMKLKQTFSSVLLMDASFPVDRDPCIRENKDFLSQAEVVKLERVEPRTSKQRNVCAFA